MHLFVCLFDYDKDKLRLLDSLFLMITREESTCPHCSPSGMKSFL